MTIDSPLPPLERAIRDAEWHLGSVVRDLRLLAARMEDEGTGLRDPRTDPDDRRTTRLEVAHSLTARYSRECGIIEAILGQVAVGAAQADQYAAAEQPPAEDASQPVLSAAPPGGRRKLSPPRNLSRQRGAADKPGGASTPRTTHST